jgi:amino acid transporter
MIIFIISKLLENNSGSLYYVLLLHLYWIPVNLISCFLLLRSDVNLKRSIGTIPLLFTAVGGIVGSGWLFGPFFAAKLAGPSALLAWVLGGCLMMVIALTFAELSSAFPIAGGTVRFLQLSHGPLVSFSMAWISWISCLAVAPIETLALLHYAANYLPWLMYTVDGTMLLTLSGIVVAGFLMFGLCIINAVGVKFMAKTNALVVTLKLIVPLFTIIVLASLSFHVSNFTDHKFAPFGLRGILASLPAAGIIFSFIGYGPAIQLAGEAKNPQRSIPIAILGALVICILLYVLLQSSFIAALPGSSFANGWQNLHFAGEAGPFSGVAMAVGAAWLAKVLFVDAAISPYGTALIYTASTARMGYAMGQDGFFPKWFLKLNKHGIPLRIILLNYVVGMFLFLPFPSWQNMMSFLVSSLVFAYAVGPLALVVLRKTLPDHYRPFRVPFYKVTCYSAFYICNLIIFWTGWYIVSKMLIAILLGYGVLLLYKRTKHGEHLDLQWQKSWWIFFYLGIISMLTFLGTFGGGRGLIPFGWDFLVIAIISYLIYELSQRCALDSEEASRHELNKSYEQDES